MGIIDPYHWEMAPSIKLPEPWLTLAQRMRGVGKLAKSLGVSRRYLAFWAKGERVPASTARLMITALFQEYGVPPPDFGRRGSQGDPE